MNKYKNHILTGVLLGIIMPMIAFVGYAKYNSPHSTIAEVWEVVVHLKILGTVMSFSAFGNLIPFFVFIKLDADKSARGVLIATMLYVVAILILKVSG